MDAITINSPLSRELTWKGALDRYNEAVEAHEKESDALSAETRKYFDTRTSTGDPQPPEMLAAEESEAAACDALWEALDALLATRAPSLDAVALKVKLACYHDRESGSFTTIIADLTSAIEDDARGWLKRFTALGGSVMPDITNPDKFNFWVPSFSYSPARKAYDDAAAQMRDQPWFQALDEKQREDHLQRSNLFYRDRYEGAIKELLDLIDDMPSIRAAMKSLVSGDPSLGLGVAAPAEQEEMA